MDRNYYIEYYFLERYNWWYLIRLKIIKSIIQRFLCYENKNLKILNVGIATGKTSQLLQEFGEVSSIEFDKECIEYTKLKTSLNITQGSITELPFNNDTFDIVCAFDVIEHVENYIMAVKELKRVCKTNGYVFITVPAYQFLWSSHDEINYHKRRYTMKQIVSFFKEEKIIYKTYFNTILFPPVLFFRLFSKYFIKNKKINKSDFTFFEQKRILNTLMYAIFNIEYYLLKIISFKFGVSLMLLWKK